MEHPLLEEGEISRFPLALETMPRPARVQEEVEQLPFLPQRPAEMVLTVSWSWKNGISDECIEGLRYVHLYIRGGYLCW